MNIIFDNPLIFSSANITGRLLKEATPYVGTIAAVANIKAVASTIPFNNNLFSFAAEKADSRKEDKYKKLKVALPIGNNKKKYFALTKSFSTQKLLVVNSERNLLEHVKTIVTEDRYFKIEALFEGCVVNTTHEIFNLLTDKINEDANIVKIINMASVINRYQSLVGSIPKGFTACKLSHPKYDYCDLCHGYNVSPDDDNWSKYILDKSDHISVNLRNHKDYMPNKNTYVIWYSDYGYNLNITPYTEFIENIATSERPFIMATIEGQPIGTSALCQKFIKHNKKIRKERELQDKITHEIYNMNTFLENIKELKNIQFDVELAEQKANESNKNILERIDDSSSICVSY